MPRQTRLYILNGTTRGAMAVITAACPHDPTNVEYQGAPEIINAAPVIQNRSYFNALFTVENWAREQGFVVKAEWTGEFDSLEIYSNPTPVEAEA